MNLFELFVKIGVDDNASSAIKNMQKSSETLANKIKVMSTQFESSKKNVDELTKKFNESVKKTGAASKETQDLAKKLNNAEKQAEQAKRALDEYNDELDQTRDKTSDSTTQLSKFTSVLGGDIGKSANIGMMAITAVIAVVGAAAKTISEFTSKIKELTTDSIKMYAEYEQLVGGAEKIFNAFDIGTILQDAKSAYLTLGMSANQYLRTMNDVGATFAATMGDRAGYETAKIGLQAISDYASGTGKSIDELSSKFTLITRSTTSYQSIADQFSGILPATSNEFLKQAKAAGFLKESYKQLTEVPVDEYQEAVAKMLEKGVSALGLTGNTAMEATKTLSGSITATKSSWENLLTAMSIGSTEDVQTATEKFSASLINSFNLIVDRIPYVLESIPTIMEEFFPNVIEMIPRLINKDIPKILSSILDIFSGLNENKDAILDGLTNLLTNSLDQLLQMTPELTQSAIEILSALGVAIGNSSQTLIPAFLRIINAMNKTFNDNEPLVLEAALAIISGIASGLLESLPLLVEAYFNMFDQVFSLVDADVLVMVLSAAAKIIASLASGIILGIPQVVASLERLIFRLISNFTTQDWSSLGKDMIDGIADGITKTFSNFKKTFEDMIGGLEESAQKALGIASPSKVFKKIGGFTAEGFGIGFEDEFAKVKGDMENALAFDDPSIGINSSIRTIGAEAAGFGYGGTSIGNVNITVNGANYADEQSLAAAIATEIQNMTDRRAAVYA